MTEKELAKLLASNPDIAVADGCIHYGLLDDPKNVDVHSALPKLSERDLQAAIVEECDRQSIGVAEYGLIFCVPNGQYRQGQRMEPGLRPGIPDLFLPVARRGYHGLFIELKCGTNKPRQEQLEWAHKLKRQGYRCVVIWDSVGAAMAEIQAYLEGK